MKPNKKNEKKLNLIIFTWRDLIDSAGFGGHEVYLDNIADGLKKDFNVTVFSSKAENQKKNEVLDGIRYMRRGSRYTVYIWAMLYYVFKLRKNIDLVIDTENGIPFFTPFYSRKPKLLLMHHFHNGQWFKEFPYPVAMFGYSLERFVLPFAYRNTKIVTVSNSSKLDLEVMGVDNKNIAIAHNGIDVKDTQAKGLYKTPTILSLGRLREYKRIDLAIRAIADLKKRGKKANLIIAGTGDDQDRLKVIAKELKVSNRVKFLGFVDDATKNRLLKKSWVFVNTSSKEGWGIVNIEANHFGTPVLGFNVYGVRDSVKDGVSGLLATDYEDFVNKLEALVSNKVAIESISGSCKKWADNFGWDKTIDIFKDELNKLVGIKKRNKKGIKNEKKGKNEEKYVYIDGYKPLYEKF